MSVPNKKSTFNTFWSILALTFVCLVINLPPSIPVKIHWQKINFEHTFYRPKFNFKLGPIDFSKTLNFRYGLDLAGGSSLIFDIDTSGVKKEVVAEALESLKGNIERRVNLFGLSESSVQLSTQGDKHRLTVDLPGVENTEEAVSLIGQTAKLSFKGEKEIAPEATSTATFNDVFAADTGLDGSHLVSASVKFNPNTSEPEVALEFNPAGAKLFEAATKKFLNKRIAIFLDDYPITFPTVQSVIPDGQAVINGNFDTKTAKTLAAQLNAGALPLPIKVVQQSKVGATLGQDTIDKGILAGIVGIIIVSLFMIANYGFFGLIADVSILIYGLITLTLYRLIPITLTFPGIVGFLLSVGMAVDSNILIFARFREEILAGKPWNQAMELAFGRAWSSIRDANFCTIITGLILFNPFNWSFLNTSGMVRGFAITLILGIFISIFTGVVVTRNLLRVFARRDN
jgi:preprotein translocase subunit SecD